MPRSFNQEHIVAQGRAFFALHQRLPTLEEVKTIPWLPCYHAIRKYVGWKQWLVLIQETEDVGTRHRVCLKCNSSFSPSPPDARVCPSCKLTDDWHDTTDWFCGYTVTRHHVDGFLPVDFDIEETVYAE